MTPSSSSTRCGRTPWPAPWSRRRWPTGRLDRQADRGKPDGRAPSLRRILIDLIEEYARHVGHADLIRESVDGLVGEDPPR
ncbi:DUF664 domain-containing protein [Streptomyces formicae]|uniref:mycothiol transferase n=1 Tax=Streptomyces formicae TaxID=1616117 RepID=UPI003613EE38